MAPYTPRQSEYLAFIAQYRELAQASPSEGEIAKYFGVSGASAHQMLVTLEAKGFIFRVPGIWRSVRLNVHQEDLPVLGGPGRHEANRADRASTWAAFSVYLAGRLVATGYAPFARYTSALRLAIRVEQLLTRLRAKPALVDSTLEEIRSIAESALPARTEPSAEIEKLAPPQEPKPPKVRVRRVREVPPEQGELF